MGVQSQVSLEQVKRQLFSMRGRKSEGMGTGTDYLIVLKAARVAF
jgi:hypothetical protein